MENVSFCVLQINESRTGLEKHESKYIIFILASLAHLALLAGSGIARASSKFLC